MSLADAVSSNVPLVTLLFAVALFGPTVAGVWPRAAEHRRRRLRLAQLRAWTGRPTRQGCHHCGYDVPPFDGIQCPRCGRSY